MTEPSSQVVVTDNPDHTRFEAHLAGELAGVLAYDTGDDGARVLLHTVVGEEHGGRGVGSALASHAMAEAREGGRRITVQCTFVRGWLERHPEHADLLA